MGATRKERKIQTLLNKKEVYGSSSTKEESDSCFVAKDTDCKVKLSTLQGNRACHINES